MQALLKLLQGGPKAAKGKENQEQAGSNEEPQVSSCVCKLHCQLQAGRGEMYCLSRMPFRD